MPYLLSSNSIIRRILIDHPNQEVSSFIHMGFAQINNYKIGKAIHCLILRRSFDLGIFRYNTLINMYFRFGNSISAIHLFDNLPQPNTSSWNTVISGCVRVGRFGEAFELFRGMREEGIGPDGFVVASMVTACNRWVGMGKLGVSLHAFAWKVGLMDNVYVGTALMHLYGSCGLVFEGLRVFVAMRERNVVSWTALMVSFSDNGYLSEAMRTYREMRMDGVVSNSNSFASVISACSSLENEKLSLQVIGHAVVHGLETEVSVANSLMTLFGNIGRIEDAENLFYRMKEKDTISWNSIITVYSHEGMCKESLQLFSDMRHANVVPDATTMSSLIAACSCLDNLKWGRGLQGLTIKNSWCLYVSVNNTLISMYSVLGNHDAAELLFYSMPVRDLISWNSMISAYAQHGLSADALKLINQMLQEKKEINHVTFANALASCSSPESLQDGKIIHALVIQIGLQENLLVGNALITMYGKCKAMREAQRVLRIMTNLDLITFNTLIGGHVENHEKREAVEAFVCMREVGIDPNYITIVNILGAFIAPDDLLRFGAPIHSYILSTGLDSDEYVKNSLLTMYAKCGDLGSSMYIFEALETKTVVSWNAMIASKAHNGHGEDALKLFVEMQLSGMELDQFSFSGGLAASANLASVEEGQQLHCLIIKHGFYMNIHVINALMDMYGKCGKMGDVLKILPEPVQRSQQSWNILISAYARHGCFEKSEDTFRQMVHSGQKPDHVTFVSLLSSCSHRGLVDKGLAYFKSMTSEFGISPGIEHCVCMVDLLGRAGRLSEAEMFIQDMVIEPNDLIWRSLLSSCRTYRNLEIGKRAAQCLIEFDNLDDSAYVLLSNAYATGGRWEDVDRVRSQMDSINVKKKLARSWIKVRNQVNTFGIGDRDHPQTVQIYAKLEEILQLIKEVGYVVDTSFALHDTDEEQKEHNLWNHSEKLALAFGLLNIPEEASIRVFKNLRVCGDCHLVYKLVSKVVNREIMLRDSYRFHHFKDGECSCSDYW